MLEIITIIGQCQSFPSVIKINPGSICAVSQIRLSFEQIRLAVRFFRLFLQNIFYFFH